MIHRLIGSAVVVAWLWLTFHLGLLIPNLDAAASSSVYRAGSGAMYVLGLPVAAAALLIYPEYFVDRFSPVSGLTGEPLLGVGVWRLLGYVALLISWGLLELFRA
ncbi:hypothetical protein EZM97_15670 [Dyella soli]|uniref:Uncharacterized protein n=2 Tax=Dyella soli TaxID=522319 RepID=A0A4R0YQZ4_9GAMM|nr:hypothetical protein EZM97_15670 [Dyella soli]